MGHMTKYTTQAKHTYTCMVPVQEPYLRANMEKNTFKDVAA